MNDGHTNPMTSFGPRPLVVFADDWQRHPSSSQHLVKHMLSVRRVHWINTIGTRKPNLGVDLLKRGHEKIAGWSKRPRDQHRENPRVYNPVMYPGYRSPLQRRLNAMLLSRFLLRRIPSVDEAVVLTSVPIVADLPERVPALRWVYYCVDDFSAWPGLDAEPLREMERKLVGRADRIVAAGPNLAERIRGFGRDSVIISHGIDLDMWSAPQQAVVFPPHIQPPIFLFWGLIDRRLDIEILGRLDGGLRAGTIVLVGPQQDPDPALKQLSRVQCIGPRPYESLPALAAAAAVLIMPYADLPVTRAMQPLKLKEYLATGRPVVCSRLPAVQEWASCLDIAETPQSFLSLAEARADGVIPEHQSEARRRLEAEAWTAKSVELARILFDD